ncbi:MAG: hypothetical protein WCW52_00635 [Elusimicrobiales bacterium]|jgi:flagellar hook assembly protein FlgD
MNRKILSVLISVLSGVLFSPAARAQQLFVSSVTVGDGGYNYCTTGMGIDRSFETQAFPPNPVNVWANSSRIEFDKPQASYPGGCLALCAQIVCVSTAGAQGFGVNELSFEIFKFVSGGNALDPASTPPIKTISMYDIGMCRSVNNQKYYVNPGATSNGNYYYCTNWDGSYNLNGMFGKTNGQFGFRARVKTNEVSPQVGNISIEQTAAFPGQNQIPIQVDVMNIHTVRSSPTVVGKITGVGAQPYNIMYRLSKDATTTIRIYSAFDNGSHVMPLVRTLLDHIPRVGEGTPDGTLTNGDFWDGRDDHGAMAAPGVYRAQIDAESQDNWVGVDNAYPYTATISHDPLQITDIAIKPLGSTSTDQAVISYTLTESATVYVGIYTPNTVFADINNVQHTQTVTAGSQLRLVTEQKTGRQTVSTIWDGRDNNGNPVCDGEYVYAIWAELPSAAGVIRNQRLAVGAIPVARGLVISLLSPSSTVIGSSPSVAGLDPFYFRYTPVRDALVTMNILDAGNNSVRTLINRQPRAANFANRELWDGRDDYGNYVSSGIYQAELISEDPYACSSSRVTTTTVRTPVDMFRVVDVRTTPLMGGTSDTATVSFNLSQTMSMTLNVYRPGTVIPAGAGAVWPPIGLPTPVYSVSGIRPGRFNVTEYWDGLDTPGEMVADGRYPFTLVAVATGAAQAIYASDHITGYIDVSRGHILFTMFEVIPTIPVMYNSSDTVKLPPYEIDYLITRQSSVTVQILNNPSVGLPQVVADVVNGEVRDGVLIQKDFWDGKCTNTPVCPNNDFVPWDSYNVRIVARDIGKNLLSVATAQQTIEVNPLRIFDMAITPMTQESPGIVSYQVSEPMKVATKIYRPGTSLVACANPAADCYPSRLVKMFVGVRPARSQILEYWDGTDLTLSKVPDGNYVFKVYGSTSTDSVSMLDGKVLPGIGMASDAIISNIPVANGPSRDDVQLAKDIWFAPNPYTGTAGYFHIPIYVNSELSIKIYNLTGDLIYRYSSGLLGGEVDHTVLWPRTNTAGKQVAPGVYFAVIRLEGRDGAKGAFQTVKKILVP